MITQLRELDDLVPKSLWFIDLWVLDLENAINYLSARNVSLNELWIDLERIHRDDVTQWDLDPASLLRELDAEKRISTAVGKFANLNRLLISNFRASRRSPEPMRVPYKWTAVQPRDVNRVKVDHFARAQSVFCTRRTEIKAKANSLSTHYLTEKVLIHFKKMEEKGRKPVY